MSRPKRNAAKQSRSYVDVDSDAEESDAGGELKSPADDGSISSDFDAKPPAKKKKKGVKKGSHQTPLPKDLPLLSFDILTHVMEMLWPREILQFASMSKSFMDMVSYKHVIHAGVVTQKLGVESMTIKTTKYKYNKRVSETHEWMDKIMSTICSRTVYLPSPMRLLRLLCGKKCERPGCGRLASVLPNTLLHACSGCAVGTDLLRIVATKDFGVSHITRFRRVALEYSVGTNKNEVSALTQPYVDQYSGKRIGPCFSACEIGSLLWERKTAEDHDLVHKDEPGYPTEEAVAEIMGIYENAQNGYARLDAEMEVKAIQKKQEAEQEKAEKKERKRVRAEKAKLKREKIESIIKTMKESLDKKWKQFALRVSHWNGGMPDIQVSGVKEITKKLFRNPEKATAAKIADAVGEINSAYQAVFDRKISGGWTGQVTFPEELRGNTFAHSIRNNYYGG